MKSLRLMLLSLFLLPSALEIKAQTNDTLRAVVRVSVNRVAYDGDSIPNVKLHEFYCMPPMQFRNKKEQEKYNRMVRNIKYVFPYAQLVRSTLIETHDYLETLPNDKARKQHIALVEKGVKEQYTPIVKKMSRSQGKLLVKLVDRECGQTSYEMVKAFLGPVKASVYQVVAGLFGNSLTKHYDPEGEDKHTERIVRMVESGQI
ncbi:MAG: DUF4294 domain-containing protein [Bacteroidaceae bacterium]|nr:DUF4294 domain-containing protein [Bacteroidaceae bacterium]